LVDPTPNIKLSTWGIKSFSFQHDITDGIGGFDPGYDHIDSYGLRIGLRDDCDRYKSEWALIDLPGFLTDKTYEVDYFDKNIGMSLAGWFQLNSFGKLDVTIKALCGDFYFDYSYLCAKGCDNPVPIPATAVLFGSGILGLVGIRYRFLKR
jgi:hypothetical protein